MSRLRWPARSAARHHQRVDTARNADHADYGLLAFNVRGRNSWLRMWLLDTGIGAVYIAEDHTPAPSARLPISRACFMNWCEDCPVTFTGPDGQPATCQCPHHHLGDIK